MTTPNPSSSTLDTAEPASTDISGKRPRMEDQEFKSLADLSPTKRAKVHGHLETLSPVKDNVAGTRKYFTGKVTDGKVTRRIVGFDTKIHQSLLTYKAKKLPVALSNCQVKESNFSPDLEIIVRKSSDLQRSPLEFNIDPTTLESTKEVLITLDSLSGLTNFQQVSVKIKVIHLSDVVKFVVRISKNYLNKSV